MKRFHGLMLLALMCSCSRSRPSIATRVMRTAPIAPAPAAATHAHDRDEAEREGAIMRDLQEMSAFASSDDGARDFVTDLAAAARAHDTARWERLERELVADDVRFELALTFEGSRQLGSRVIPGLGARASQLRTVLASMREPLLVSLRSATGETFADGAAHGFHPAIASVRHYLRPAVRFVRAEITDAGGQHVVIEPMAWLAGRWTWLGEPWTALPATTPVTVPATTAQR